MQIQKEKQDAEIHIHDSEGNERKWTGCGVLRIIWLAIVIICILGVGYALFDVNVQGIRNDMELLGDTCCLMMTGGLTEATYGVMLWNVSNSFQ